VKSIKACAALIFSVSWSRCGYARPGREIFLVAGRQAAEAQKKIQMGEMYYEELEPCSREQNKNLTRLFTANSGRGNV
jgi:hypothetical protein